MGVLRGLGGLLLALGLVAGVACGSDTAGPSNTVGTGGAAASAGSGVGGAGAIGGFGPTGGSFSVDSGAGAGGLAGREGGLDGPVCGAEEHVSGQSPVDLLIMLDQSSSMLGPVATGGDIWTNVVTALTNFVQAPEAAGIGVGIEYFPQGLYATEICDVARYATPEVAIAPLPGVGSAIVQSIGNHRPLGNTPTSAALQGALQYAKTWAAAHLDRQTIVVFATDGEPTECDPIATNLIAQYARDALSQAPKVFTFVIGIGQLGNLNPIAEAGGTRRAFIIDPTQQNVAQEVTKTLLRIAASPLGCSFALPPGQNGTATDPNKVNIDFAPSDGGALQQLVRVTGPGNCGQVPNGWYYDDPVNPQRILICDGTCNGFGAGSLTIQLGCPTRIPQ
jgi:hypothetical protein